MSRPEESWERLVKAALRSRRRISANVPSSLANNREIDDIQDKFPNVARVLCEHAYYSLSQNLDPNSEGRGVLQFLTGLMSVIKDDMSRPEELWERLVKATLRSRRPGTDGYSPPVGGISSNVPSSLANNRKIDDILRASYEIQDESPYVARVLCEYAHSLSKNLDPNSEGRGVLLFKTGLMSVIKQKLAKTEGGVLDRSQDIPRLRESYRKYRETNDVGKLREEEMRLRDSASFSGNLGELERKAVRRRKRVLATLIVLGSVLENLTKDLSPEEADRLISDDVKRMIKEDEAMTEDLVSYNIIPVE